MTPDNSHKPVLPAKLYVEKQSDVDFWFKVAGITGLILMFVVNAIQQHH